MQCIQFLWWPYLIVLEFAAKTTEAAILGDLLIQNDATKIISWFLWDHIFWKILSQCIPQIENEQNSSGSI